ncbi:hypothetical protein B0O99DRAFT_605865 [Bisporella sp. PMI_857]|nr:hypothetical protein B0O99DRAFT_605865 [Bisporella sp. PMI_857]
MSGVKRVAKSLPAQISKTFKQSRLDNFMSSSSKSPAVPKGGEDKAEPQTKIEDPPAPPSGDSLFVTEKVGAIFEAPQNTVIIHACNCVGSWSAGIAAAFKQRYPRAFIYHKRHCDNHTPSDLIGTALLIPPMETKGPRHFVGCLFTSKRYGRDKDSPAEILRQTEPAMKDLMRAIKEYNEKGTADDKVDEIRMCQINSGLFAVPWAKTKEVIESIEIGDEGDTVSKEIIVYSLPPTK